jgi:predicted MFS family arabinose efflux permease
VTAAAIRNPLYSERPRRAGPGLAALATAAFVYVTAETLPVGLLSPMSAGLHVRPAAVGLLVTIYAAVAGLMAVPVTVLTGRLSRRRVVVGSVALLALSQLVMALAPDYPVVLAARVGCAFAHGVFWSVLAPVAGRLAAPGRAGRATAIVFTGNSLALVLGTPLATALGEVLGWRAATAVVGAAAAVSVAALRGTLPALPAEAPGVAGGGLRARFTAIPAALRSRSLVAVCVVTLLVVTGHFIPYTYISVLVRRDAGLTGLALSLVLLVYGVAGVAGIGLTGWATDRRPRLAAAGCAVTLTVALAVMAAIAPGSAAFTVAAVAAWGAAFTAIPVALQSAVLRVAPRSADTASALYVVAFQIGIGGGALAGSVLVDNGLPGQLPIAGLVLAAAGTAVLLAARRAFPARPLPSRPGIASVPEPRAGRSIPRRLDHGEPPGSGNCRPGRVGSRYCIRRHLTEGHE